MFFPHFRLPIDVEKWSGYIVGYVLCYFSAYFVSLTAVLYVFFISISLYVKVAFDEVRFKLKTINQNRWVMNRPCTFSIKAPQSDVFFLFQIIIISVMNLASFHSFMVAKFNSNSSKYWSLIWEFLSECLCSFLLSG